MVESAMTAATQATESNLVADRTIVWSSQFAPQHVQPSFKFKRGFAAWKWWHTVSETVLSSARTSTSVTAPKGTVAL